MDIHGEFEVHLDTIEADECVLSDSKGVECNLGLGLQRLALIVFG